MNRELLCGAQCGDAVSAIKTGIEGDGKNENTIDRVVGNFNQHCFCISLPEGALQVALEQELASPDVFRLIRERCPHLFSAQPVLIANSQAERMRALIQAIDQLGQLASYRDYVLARAPSIARHQVRQVKGVFFGYDFHLHDNQIGLIEVNTNAGGAMLNAVLARAQRACCDAMQEFANTSAIAIEFETAIVGMFQEEWRLAHSSMRMDGREPPILQTIAIVDSAPEEQYLYPEFLLFQQLFARHGIKAMIAAPQELQWKDGALWCREVKLDLVYNRLTDFYLEDESSQALRQAYLADGVVLTPHPQAHAIYADKANLALWTNREFLTEIGVTPEMQAILLDAIPHSEVVRVENAERLWANRRHLFFKPNAGFGGRAAYRGDKITKRVWEEILAGDYIAQAIVAPGERVSGTPQSPSRLKFDLRFYAYDGQAQWIAARMYQGQTTNFRTTGGGFAPVYCIDDGELNSSQDRIADMLRY